DPDPEGSIPLLHRDNVSHTTINRSPGQLRIDEDPSIRDADKHDGRIVPLLRVLSLAGIDRDIAKVKLVRPLHLTHSTLEHRTRCPRSIHQAIQTAPTGSGSAGTSPATSRRQRST